MIALVVAFTSSIFLFMKYKHPELINNFAQNKHTSSTNQAPIASQNPNENSKTVESSQTIASRSRSTVPGANDIVPQSDLQLKNETASQNLAGIPKDEASISKKTSAQQVKGDPYQHAVDELIAFYSHLDQQPYMQDFHLKEPSKKHFSKLLQALIDNPPSVTRETDDYFTLLKNTAHFYRILGKDNILILKGILDREKDSFENILKTFYTLTDHPEYLKKEFSLTIPKDNLYDYAGFFLNTIGGRLYLFRRDSASRMTISYYAVLIIDKANRQGNSRLGIDLRPAIDSLIEEIENTGNNLKFKEEYLDTLYDLKENYGNRD